MLDIGAIGSDGTTQVGQSALGAFLGGPVGAALGTIGGGLFDRRSARKERQHREAREDSAYQRAAADMEKAGLNRILALGSPAASGAQANFAPTDVGGAFTRGQDTRLRSDRQKALLDLEQSILHSNSYDAAKQPDLTQAQIDKTKAEVDNVKVITEGVKSENLRRKEIGDMYKSLGPMAIPAQMFLESLGGGTGKAIFDLLGGKRK